MGLFETINAELLGEPTKDRDGIVNHTTIWYSISVEDTKVNMYGESSAGKVYNSGVKIACLTEADNFDWTNEEFGTDEGQNVQFYILRQQLIDLDIVPQMGDIFEWNSAYFEINAIDENQLLAGDPNKNWSFNCTCHRIRKSNLNIERTRSK